MRLFRGEGKRREEKKNTQDIFLFREISATASSATASSPTASAIESLNSLSERQIFLIRAARTPMTIDIQIDRFDPGMEQNLPKSFNPPIPKS